MIEINHVNLILMTLHLYEMTNLLGYLLLVFYTLKHATTHGNDRNMFLYLVNVTYLSPCNEDTMIRMLIDIQEECTNKVGNLYLMEINIKINLHQVITSYDLMSTMN